jgi:hypothetical protein
MHAYFNIERNKLPSDVMLFVQLDLALGGITSGDTKAWVLKAVLHHEE